MVSPALKRTKACWHGMKHRCYNQKSLSYKNYGARGITVCEPWLASFENFLSDMGIKPDGCSIDRVDNNGNYEPSNCRWATPAEQRRNQRTVRALTFNGETKLLRHWAREIGMPEQTLHTRLGLGWTIEEALTTPINQALSKCSAKGKVKRWQKSSKMLQEGVEIVSNSNNGGAAFPRLKRLDSPSHEYTAESFDGMSLRDYFAAEAPPPPTWWMKDYASNAKDLGAVADCIAQWNYEYADAMIKRREL